MKKQIRNLDGIIGLTVDSVAAGGVRDWDDTGNSIVISLSNGTFVIIGAECNWSDGADVVVDTEIPRTSEFLVDAGVFAQEEHCKRVAEEKKKREDAARKRDLEQLAKLRAKYGRGG